MILWDSHPLALGATPQQVWIDGIPQLSSPHTRTKPAALQHVPEVPNFDEEAKETLKHDGLPPLEPKTSITHMVVFANVSSVFVRKDTPSGAVVEQIASSRSGSLWAVVQAGKLVCVDTLSSTCVQSSLQSIKDEVEVIDLAGGSITPGLTTFGSNLGLEEISGEVSTKDGTAPDVLSTSIPGVAGGNNALIRAIDGLQFSTRHALYVLCPCSSPAPYVTERILQGGISLRCDSRRGRAFEWRFPRRT